MATYSIKDLEKISGIKAHTLRVWEQRYGILKPKRTATNIRYYDGSDLKLLLNICMLNANGYKISKIASMTLDELHHQVLDLQESSEDFESQIKALTLAMINLDEVGFEKAISINTLRFGFETTMIKIIYPFFENLGILWQTGSVSPAQEHFISNLIRQKLIVAIDAQEIPRGEDLKKFLLYLPEGEFHEITLLFSCYILKARHNKVFYLGQSLPEEDLISIHDTYRPDYILTIMTNKPTNGSMKKYLKELAGRFPESVLLLSGKAVEDVKEDLPQNSAYLNGLEDLLSYAGK